MGVSEGLGELPRGATCYPTARWRPACAAAGLGRASHSGGPSWPARWAKSGGRATVSAGAGAGVGAWRPSRRPGRRSARRRTAGPTADWSWPAARAAGWPPSMRPTGSCSALSCSRRCSPCSACTDGTLKFNKSTH
jgi:hypothetical protein